MRELWNLKKLINFIPDGLTYMWRRWYRGGREALMNMQNKFMFWNFRKIISAMYLLLFSLFLIGCSNDEKAENKYYWQSFYKKAEYDILKKPASENGLAGTLYYLSGKISKIIDLEEVETGSVGIVLTDQNKRKWFLIANTTENTIPEIDDKIVAYMDYQGITTEYNDYPCGFLLRYKTGEIYEKMKYDGKVYAYLSSEGTPEYIYNWDVTTENEIDYYNVYLSDNAGWSTMDMSEQTNLIEDYVEYFRDYSVSTNKGKDKVNIMVLDNNGYNAFYCDRNDKIQIYKDGIYDYEYYIVE